MNVVDNRLHLGPHFAGDLVARHGSPLYVYEESVIRERCRELKRLVRRANFQVNYSPKANSNVALLRIMREEGVRADAMSPGEMFLLEAAGFRPDEIVFIGNNVAKSEMQHALDRGIRVSVDSLTQLEWFGELNPGGEVIVRINPSIGDGHSEKVITGGKTKFGIPSQQLDDIRRIATRHRLTVMGVNMHIGSLFLKPDKYLAAIHALLEVARQVESVRFADFGGGIGIPYRKGTEQRFPMKQFGEQLEAILGEWERTTGRRGVTFAIEPGRYPVAESCTLLTTVHSTKENFGTVYVGTDVGFNVLIRPELYGAYHEIVVCDAVERRPRRVVSVCGNVCETGDLVARDRELPEIGLGETLAILDAGAYGFSMASNYNARLRPAEILIEAGGGVRVIRERDTFEQLLLNQRY